MGGWVPAAADWIPRVAPYFSRERLWEEGLCKELVGILGKPSPCQLWRAKLAWPGCPPCAAVVQMLRRVGARVKPR